MGIILFLCNILVLLKESQRVTVGWTMIWETEVQTPALL